MYEGLGKMLSIINMCCTSIEDRVRNKYALKETWPGLDGQKRLSGGCPWALKVPRLTA